MIRITTTVGRFITRKRREWMPNNDIILFVLTIVILVLAVVIAVLMWQVQRRRQLLERRREVIERENREAEALLREREQGIGDDIPKFRDIESEAENPQLTIPFN